jgi:DNA-directed RNA polymerase subunit RPC12/RpoP
MNQQKGQYEGTDYVCDNCGCEIMVKHTGDHSKHISQSYICRCGREMRLEHSQVGAER